MPECTSKKERPEFHSGDRFLLPPGCRVFEDGAVNALAAAPMIIMKRMSNTILGANHKLSLEIGNGLEALGKGGYTAEVQQTPTGIAITFTLGENTQTLSFTREQWQKSGAVSADIVAHLNI